MNSQLFIGVSIDARLEQELACASSALLSLFATSGLERVEMERGLFLGKTMRCPALLSDLEMMEKHLLSILHRLAPSLALTKASLHILWKS